MENGIKNTMYEFKFEDGTSENLTLAFYALYQLKAKNKAIYEEYNKIMTKGANEELDMITVLYAAYLCANIADIGGCMTLEQFMIKCGSSRYAVKDAMEYLVKPKKQ
jgi:hypothetical protein